MVDLLTLARRSFFSKGDIIMSDLSSVIRDCPLCGANLEQPVVQNEGFLDYVCTNCGLKWQACVDTQSEMYPQVAQTWMHYLSQD